MLGLPFRSRVIASTSLSYMSLWESFAIYLLSLLGLRTRQPTNNRLSVGHRNVHEFPFSFEHFLKIQLGLVSASSILNAASVPYDLPPFSTNNKVKTKRETFTHPLPGTTAPTISPISALISIHSQVVLHRCVSIRA